MKELKDVNEKIVVNQLNISKFNKEQREGDEEYKQNNISDERIRERNKICVQQ